MPDLESALFRPQQESTRSTKVRLTTPKVSFHARAATFFLLLTSSEAPIDTTAIALVSPAIQFDTDCTQSVPPATPIDTTAIAVVSIGTIEVSVRGRIIAASGLIASVVAGKANILIIDDITSGVTLPPDTTRVYALAAAEITNTGVISNPERVASFDASEQPIRV